MPRPHSFDEVAKNLIQKFTDLHQVILIPCKRRHAAKEILRSCQNIVTLKTIPDKFLLHPLR